VPNPTGTIDMTETLSRDHLVTSIETLEGIYGHPHGPSVAKETDRITTHYRAFIEAAPFFALATAGPDGLDCSPRGDAPGFVRIFYQCAKAIVRSKLWDATCQVERKSLPSSGMILAELTGGKLGGEAHDRGAPERLKATLY